MSKQLKTSEITPAIEQNVIALYLKGMPYQKIENEINLNQRHISQIIIKYNIPSRKKEFRQKLEAGLKVCTKCHQEKALSEFNKKTDSSTGIASYCKVCEGIKHQTYYLKNKKTALKKSCEYRRLHPNCNSDYWHKNKERLSALRKHKRKIDPRSITT